MIFALLLINYYFLLTLMLSFLHSKRDGGTVDLEKCSKAIQVSDKMKGVMYFT